MEFEEDGSVRVLDAKTWEQRRREARELSAAP